MYKKLPKKHAVFYTGWVVLALKQSLFCFF